MHTKTIVMTIQAESDFHGSVGGGVGKGPDINVILELLRWRVGSQS